MKLTVSLFLALLLSSFNIQAQTAQTQTALHITTSSKQLCYWDADTKKFDINCDDNPEYVSLFEFNADGTVITHTTSNIKSSYFVTSKKYDADYAADEYEVTSDVGNKYTFIVNLNAKNFVILSDGHSSTANDYIIKYAIKSHWTE